MQKDGLEGSEIAVEKHGNWKKLPSEGGGESSEGKSVDKDLPEVISIVISCGDVCNQLSTVSDSKANISKVMTGDEKDERADAAAGTKKGCLQHSESYHEQCRVCQQQTEEALMDLGCRCRGELAKVHRSCIEMWFRTRGSNKCEICQQVAVNVSCPQIQPNASYWIWRVDPAFGGATFVQGGRERGCYSSLWIAFSILIGGLLLDVLISISLGVSALPVNIIIGVLVVLGLGTVLRLALECCHGWSRRREVQRVDTNINPGYHPAV